MPSSRSLKYSHVIMKVTGCRQWHPIFKRIHLTPLPSGFCWSLQCSSTQKTAYQDQGKFQWFSGSSLVIWRPGTRGHKQIFAHCSYIMLENALWLVKINHLNDFYQSDCIILAKLVMKMEWVIDLNLNESRKETWRAVDAAWWCQ